MQRSTAWFDELVEATRFPLAAYLRKLLGDEAEIQDVVQEALFSVYRALRESGPAGHNPSALLYTAARNAAMSRLRHDKVVRDKAQRVMVFEELRTSVRSVEQRIDADQQRSMMLRAVNSLPPKCRQVMSLRMLYGHSHRQISEQLNISVSTIEKHLAKGVRVCREFVAAEACAQRCAVEARVAKVASNE